MCGKQYDCYLLKVELFVESNSVIMLVCEFFSSEYALPNQSEIFHNVPNTFYFLTHGVSMDKPDTVFHHISCFIVTDCPSLTVNVRFDDKVTKIINKKFYTYTYNDKSILLLNFSLKPPNT